MLGGNIKLIFKPSIEGKTGGLRVKVLAPAGETVIPYGWVKYIYQ